jgi:hypothetical protein
MPRPPKFHFPGALYFFTTSVEEGCMFPPNETTRELVLKSIARAQELHTTEIIDIIIHPTHIHMLLRAIGPSGFKGFVKCFKCEMAHALNGILGRKKRTIWCSGYDSPYIPDLETALEKIVYIYSNPSNDCAVDSIDQFPGFNTFHLRKGMATGELPLEKTSILTYYIPRPEFTPIKHHSPEGYRKYRERLISNKKTNSLTINPNAVSHKFGITDEAEIRKLNAAIVTEVRRREEKNRVQRQQEGKGVVGVKRLVSTPIGAPYIPNRTGRRMRVHCIDRTLRI